MGQAVLKLLVLKTAQVEPLRAFYEYLGISFQSEKHGSGPVHLAGAAGETILEIYPLPANEPACTSTPRLGFQITNADAVLKALTERGVPLRRSATPGPWGNRVVVEDPDGRPVELYWR